MRLRLFLLFAVGAVLAAASGLLLVARHSSPRPPLRVALWYWHTPFEVPARDAAALRAAGVSLLFVRAGTFRIAEAGLRMALPQVWRSGAQGLEVQLDFNFGYDVVRQFASLSNDLIAASVGGTVRREIARAEHAGISVRGVQLDFDCPTRLLPKYADLLRRVRAGADPHRRLAFSVTALPTWLSSKGVLQVAERVDFLVPQFYEPEVGRTLATWKPVSRIAMVERGMREMAGTGVPFFAGIPAYGRALVYGDGGRLMGTFHDFGPRAALRHPGFRFERAFAVKADGGHAAAGESIGEQALDVSAPSPAPYSAGRRWHIVYDLPTPALVARHMSLVRKERPANCLGVVLFRCPETGEDETLPAQSLVAALTGAKARPKLNVSLTTASAPWEIIETGRAAERTPLDVALTVANPGAAGSFFAPGALTLDLHVDRAGIHDADAGEFDAVEAFTVTGTEGTGARPALLRTSLERANLFRCTRSHIAAGETVRLGPIRMAADGPTKIWGEWHLRTDDGSEFLDGTIPLVALAAQRR